MVKDVQKNEYRSRKDVDERKRAMQKNILLIQADILKTCINTENNTRLEEPTKSDFSCNYCYKFHCVYLNENFQNQAKLGQCGQNL